MRVILEYSVSSIIGDTEQQGVPERTQAGWRSRSGRGADGPVREEAAELGQSGVEDLGLGGAPATTSGCLFHPMKRHLGHTPRTPEEAIATEMAAAHQHCKGSLRCCEAHR